MVKVIFTFEVEPEKQSDYIKATAEKIKPAWEANGCQAYQIWQVEGENTFIKEMHFSDLAARDKSMSIQNPELDAAKKLWRSFVTGDFTIKTRIQKA